MRLSTVVTGVTSGLAAVAVLATPALACGVGTSGFGGSGTDPAIVPAVQRLDAGPAPTRFGWLCTARVLRGVVEPPDAGAGQRYSRLVVTNVGRRSCVLYGYSRLRLQAADGTPLPTTVIRSTNPGPSVVILAPGQRAAENLHWGVIPGVGEPADRPCEPDPAWLWAWPPYQFRPFAVPWTYGPVCQHGLFELSAYYRI